MNTRMSRRVATALAVAGLSASATVAATANAAPTAPSATTAASSTAYCGITWGSLPKASSPLTTGRVLAVRAGQHTCYDRLVFDVGRGSGALGYDVRYVSNVAGPSGIPVAIADGAKLQITVHAPATYRVPASGSITWSGWRTFRQLKWVSSFEGYTDYGLGVRARLPMRAFTITDADGSRRLVVDVAHAW